MIHDDLEDYKVNHLFLMIGEADVHNYLSARLLLRDKGTVHLVHTTQTKRRADLLKAELDKVDITVKQVELGNSSADGYKIRQKIKEKVKSIIKTDGVRIGFDYTNVSSYVAAHIMGCATEVETDFNTELPLLVCASSSTLLIEDDNYRKTRSYESPELFLAETPYQEKEKPNRQTGFDPENSRRQPRQW